MGTIELKKEIGKVIDKMPEDALLSVLNYLKSISVSKKEDISFTENVRKILSEDRELLEKLAK